MGVGVKQMMLWTETLNIKMNVTSLQAITSRVKINMISHKYINVQWINFVCDDFKTGNDITLFTDRQDRISL